MSMNSMTMYDIITILVEDFRKIKYPQLEFKFQHDSKKFQKWCESDDYQQTMGTYKKQQEAYKQAEGKLKQDFKRELLKYLEIENHPKAEIIWDLSYRYAQYPCCGESTCSDDMYGYPCIAGAAQDLVKLIKD